jgi:uncharacterized protein (TIGR03437 family)
LKRVLVVPVLAILVASASYAQSVSGAASSPLQTSNPAAAPTLAGVLNAASYGVTVAPGSIAAVFGTFSVGSLVTATAIPWPTTLSGLTLQTGSGVPVPLYYASAGQLGIQVPWEISAQGQTTITASQTGQTSTPFAAKIAAFAPGLFTMNAQGTGQGAIIGDGFKLADVANPASTGTVLQIYCTGLGAVTNQPATGTAAPSGPLATTTTTPTVTVGGVSVPVLFSGLAPGFIGLYQVNAQLPSGVPGGAAVPVVLSIGGVVSNTATIAVAPISTVFLDPAATTVPQGNIQTFSVFGIAGTVRWTVQEGAAGGSITTGGVYTAPNTPGTYHVVATSPTDATQKAVATVTITAPITFTALHSFAAVSLDASTPLAPLVQTTDGTFWGTTEFGGSGFGVGTVFKMNATGVVTIVHSFSNGANGGEPAAGLVLGPDGNLYGTAPTGGANNQGSVFRVTPSSGAVALIHSFALSEGINPKAPLVLAKDGNFYGTTTLGGASAAGTVFRMSPAGAITVVHSFIGSEGTSPFGLIQASDGNLYGVCAAGGSGDNGTVFKLTLSGSFTVLYRFAGFDGSGPVGSLLQTSSGAMYGLTAFGGDGRRGTVFAIIQTGELIAAIHSFAGSDGALPQAGLLQTSDGSLFGTTAGVTSLGVSIPGNVFRMTPAGNITVFHTFSGPDGGGPAAPLIQGADGNLYGTASGGGPGGGGVIFRLPSATLR